MVKIGSSVGGKYSRLAKNPHLSHIYICTFTSCIAHSIQKPLKVSVTDPDECYLAFLNTDLMLFNISNAYNLICKLFGRMVNRAISYASPLMTKTKWSRRIPLFPVWDTMLYK